MANYVYLKERRDGPTNLTATVSDNLAAGINDGTYVYLLVAWDDPEEKDLSLARVSYTFPWNPVIRANTGYGSTLASGVTAVVNTTPDNQGKVTFAWTAPRRLPHHYSLYVQSDTTYALSTLTNKIIPATGTVNGDIAPTATSAVITDHTARNNSIYQPIVADDTTNHYLYVRGNVLALFGATGGALTEYPSTTARTVSAMALVWDSYGLATRLTLTAGPTANQTHAVFTGGKFGSLASGSKETSVVLSPITGHEHAPREMVTVDYAGRPIKRSYINRGMDTEILLTVPYTGMSVDTAATSLAVSGGSLQQLQKWRNEGTWLDLIVSATSGTAIAPGQWLVTVKDCNDYQIPDVSDFDAVQIALNVHSYYPADYDYGYRAITAATAGSAVVRVAGPLDPRMVAGERAMILDSTGNSLYMYTIVSVTAGINYVDITMDRNMADSTDDGYLCLGVDI